MPRHKDVNKWSDALAQAIDDKQQELLGRICEIKDKRYAPLSESGHLVRKS
jgi:hypothetical protein